MHSIERRDKETKYVSDSLKTNSGIDLSLYQHISTDITSSNTEFFVVIPPTVQGVDSFTRLANEISPSRCKVYLRLSLNQLIATSTTCAVDITVHVFLLSSKSIKDYVFITGMDARELLRVGDGSNVAFDGTTYTAAYPVNTDAYTVHSHKTVRMIKNFGQQGITEVATTAAGATTQPITVNPTYFRSLTFNVPLPKTLKYEDRTKVYPTNAAPFLAIGWCYSGSGPPTIPLSQSPLVAEAQTQMWFKDG